MEVQQSVVSATCWTPSNSFKNFPFASLHLKFYTYNSDHTNTKDKCKLEYLYKFGKMVCVIVLRHGIVSHGSV